MLSTTSQRGHPGLLPALNLPLEVPLRGPEHLPARWRPAAQTHANSRGVRLSDGDVGGRPSRLPTLPLGPGADTLCVHFSADGREHGMWFAAADDDSEAPPPAPMFAAPAAPRLPAGLTTHWYVSAAGVPRADVRRGGDVLCDALLLLADPAAGGDPGDTYAPASARQARAALRAEGLTAQQAALLTQTRHRPLLATIARRAELPAPLARQMHRLLLHTLSATARGAPAAVAV